MWGTAFHEWVKELRYVHVYKIITQYEHQVYITLLTESN